MASLEIMEQSVTCDAGFAPVTCLDGDAACGLLLLCDHASAALPKAYGSLGLSRDHFSRHIAYDIGAAEVTRELAAQLRAPALMSNFSRLLIDPNRGADDPTLVMRISDRALIPGNARIDEAEIERRRSLYWRPYRQAIDARLDDMLATGIVPAIVSIHSFTPVWRDRPRPWQVGVLWDCDDRLARPFIAALRNEPDLVVGDNEPYDGALEGDTMFDHGTLRGLAHMLVEIRQDLIAEPADARAWARRLAPMIRTGLERPGHPYDPSLSEPRGIAPAARAPQGELAMMPDDKTTTELEAAAFRRLVSHLRNRTDVQNIDLMNLAGFCRNCLSNWMKDAADERSLDLSKDEARELVYGMPYEEWKAKHQSEATPEQKAAFQNSPAARGQHG